MEVAVLAGIGVDLCSYRGLYTENRRVGAALFVLETANSRHPFRDESKKWVNSSLRPVTLTFATDFGKMPLLSF